MFCHQNCTTKGRIYLGSGHAQVTSHDLWYELTPIKKPIKRSIILQLCLISTILPANILRNLTTHNDVNRSTTNYTNAKKCLPKANTPNTTTTIPIEMASSLEISYGCSRKQGTSLCIMKAHRHCLEGTASHHQNYR